MIAFLTRTFFGQSEQRNRLTEQEEMRLHSEARALINNAKNFSGMFQLIEQAEKIRDKMPDGYLVQVIGCGNIIRNGNGLILSYVDHGGRVVRFKISCSYTG